MRRLLLACCLAVLFALPLHALAATIVLDAMTDPFPPNACLPISGAPVLFQGSYCDGATCPPGESVPGCGGSAFAAPQYVAGVLAGFARTTVLTGSFGGPDAWAQILPALARLEFFTSDIAGTEGLWLDYVPAPGTPPLDLTAAGIGGLRTFLYGAISPSRPVILRVVMQPDLNGPNGGEYAEADVPVTAPGEVIIPLSAFTLSSQAMDFGSVGYVSVMLSECGSGSCTYETAPRNVALGPLAFVASAATPARRSTWGALKQAYR